MNMFYLVAVQGSSVSAFWFSLFDNGTNYCNLHNVIQGRWFHTLIHYIIVDFEKNKHPFSQNVSNAITKFYNQNQNSDLKCVNWEPSLSVDGWLLSFCIPFCTGSGLTKAPGFIEFTNEWLCLGVGVAACK